MTDNKKQKCTSVFLAGLLLLSVFAGVAAVAPAAASTNAQTLEDGETYWQGQELYRSDGVSANEVVEIRDSQSDDLVRQIEANSDGEVTFTTDDFAGGYYMEDENNSVLATFEVAQQTLDVSVEDEEVLGQDVEGEDANTTFTLDSERTGYDVIISEESLETETIASIFEDATVSDIDGDGEDEVVLTGVSSTEDVNASFTGVESGDYTFAFDVVDTTASSEALIAVRERGEISADFVDRHVTDQVGDVAEITVDLTETDEATLKIGSDESNYILNATVTNGDDDDSQVTVLYNSYNAGVDAYPTVDVKDDSDSITVNSEYTPVDERGQLQPHDYRLELFAGPDDRKTDVGVMSLSERSTDDAQTFVMPGTESVTEDALENATSELSTVAKDDYVVLKFEASGFEGYLDASNLSEANADEHGVYATIELDNPKPNFQSTEIDPGQAEVVEKLDEDTFYLAFNAGEFDEMNPEDEFKATLHVDDRNPYVDEGEEETVSTTFTVAERKAVFFADDTLTTTLDDRNVEKVSVLSEENAVIAADTTVAPGTEVSLVVESRTNAEPFIMYQDSVVGDDNRIITEFDFSDIPAGTEFEVRMSGGVSTTADGEVMHQRDASVSVSDQTLEDGIFTVDSAALSHGGYLAAYIDGEEVGQSETLDEGSHTGVNIDIGELEEDATVEVVVHLEDGAQYMTDEGEPVSDSATVSVPVEPEMYTLTLEVVDEEGNPIDDANLTLNGELVEAGHHEVEAGSYTLSASADGYEDYDQTVTVEDDQTVTVEMTEESTEPSDDEETTDEEAEGTPGFGVVVALFALVGAALLAARRQDE